VMMRENSLNDALREERYEPSLSCPLAYRITENWLTSAEPLSSLRCAELENPGQTLFLSTSRKTKSVLRFI
jgi:hypothetical protein